MSDIAAFPKYQPYRSSPEGFRLPDGTMTPDSAVYAEAWRRLAQPVLDCISDEWEVGAFDPDVVFVRKDCLAVSFTVPAKVAKALGAALTKAQRLNTVVADNYERTKARLDAVRRALDGG